MSSSELGISDSQIIEFQARQVTAATRLLKTTQPINIFNAFLLGFLFFNASNLMVIISFITAICIVAIAWLVWALFYWRVQLAKTATPTDFCIHLVFSFLMSSLFALFCAYLFITANTDQKLILIGFIAGLICAGAFALCTIPRAALVWVLPQCCIGVYSLSRVETTSIALSLCVLIIIYSLLILTTASSLHRMYILRLKAEDDAKLGRRDAEHQKERVKLLIQDFEDHVTDWLWEINSQNKLQRISHKIIDILQLQSEEIYQLNLQQLFLDKLAVDGENQTEKVNYLLEKLQGKTPFSNLILPVKMEGQVHWLSIAAKPLYDQHMQFSGWRGFCSDITSEYLHTQQIEYLANYDSLTELPNRNYFSRYFDKEDRFSRQFALLIVDLDNFKEVNDLFGHSEGDLLLKMVSKRFSEQLLEGDILTRFGGDEFVLLTYSPQKAAEIATNLLACLKTPLIIKNAKVEIKASIGISLSGVDGDSEQELFGKADMAMYDAKLSGKNTFVFFDETIEARLKNRNEMISDLKLAIEKEQFYLVYQPQVDTTQANKVMALEALLRWQHEEKGLIPPSDFIPLAEEVGLINEIGKWVLEQACKEAINWPKAICVSVNVSGIEFSSDYYVDFVLDVLNQTGLEPDRLELEVTESALIDNFDEVNYKLGLLRASNVKIALDDFGTGFSSLSYIQNLSIDKIKIDRSFVSSLGIETDSIRSKAVIDIMIKLAQTLNVELIVEGVETEEQQAILSELGCYNFQGYLFSPAKKVQQLDLFFEKAIIKQA